MEILLCILGGGIGSGLMSILLAYLNRKWGKAEQEDARITALVEASKVTMVDRVTHLGKAYIASGKISLAEKNNLEEMHRAYKALGGNGHLDTVMEEVDRLKVVAE
ncbi:MAG: hypothetical protein ACI4AO_02790 [Anaerotignum sp.]